MSEDNTRESRNAIFGNMNPTDMQRQAFAPTPERMKQDLGFEIPTETVPLPSGGKIYSQSSPLHLKDTVEIRAMTTREEDILTDRALIKKGGEAVITKLIQSCLVDKSINVGEMIAGDRNALMVAVRITGYGADYSAEIECNACGAKQQHTFDLGALPIKHLSVEPVTLGANQFSFTLPYSKLNVTFKFLSGKDAEEIAVNREAARKKGIIVENAVTTQLLYSIVAVQGDTDRGKIARFVQNMPARDSLALRNFITDNEPGIEMKQEFTCSSCAHSEEVGMPMDATFLWPNFRR